MFEHISAIDFRILSLYIKNYSRILSIRQITMLLNINYSNAFKRIKKLAKSRLLLLKKEHQANAVSLNMQNTGAIQVISFVEEMESQKIKNTTLKMICQEALLLDAFCCVGLFGSRVSGKAAKDSDWDVFIITHKVKEMQKILSKFPFAINIHIEVFSLEEFEESLFSAEETVVKHIVKNKQILYNPHPFYNIIYKWEKAKYAPSQAD
jgi:predicted nucleotidyltransferase/predicted transcriptional regulator